MTSRTLYDLLGVSPSATSSEIKRAYLELAKTHHPDVASSSSDDDTFAKISHAYDVLKNPVSRRAYDAVALAPTTSRSSTASSRAWRPANANWGRRPGFENSYAFDDDDDDVDDDGSEHEGARAAHERRAEAERARSRAKADAARWWKHEREAAERRKRVFAESAAAKTVKRGERFAEATRALWQTRAAVVWQDVAVMAIGVGVACFAGVRAMRAIGGRETRTRDE
jgi:curved DNA-binding protein CbpA